MADVWHTLPPRPPSKRAFAFAAVAIVCVTLALRTPRHHVVHAPHAKLAKSCIRGNPSRGIQRYLQRAMQQQCVHNDIVVAGEFEVDGVVQSYCWALLCNSGKWLKNTYIELHGSLQVQCKLDTGVIQLFPCPIHLSNGEIISDRTMCCIVNYALQKLKL